MESATVVVDDVDVDGLIASEAEFVVSGVVGEEPMDI